MTTLQEMQSLCWRWELRRFRPRHAVFYTLLILWSGHSDSGGLELYIRMREKSSRRGTWANSGKELVVIINLDRNGMYALKYLHMQTGVFRLGSGMSCYPFWAHTANSGASCKSWLYFIHLFLHISTVWWILVIKAVFNVTDARCKWCNLKKKSWHSRHWRFTGIYKMAFKAFHSRGIVV